MWEGLIQKIYEVHATCTDVWQGGLGVGGGCGEEGQWPASNCRISPIPQLDWELEIFAVNKSCLA